MPTHAVTKANGPQKQKGAIARLPLGEMIRRQPADLARVVLSSLLIVISVVVPVYGLTYATTVMNIGTDTMLWTVVTAYALALITQPVAARLSDTIGRRPVLVAGNLLGGMAVWGYFWAIRERNVPLICLGLFVCVSLA